MKVNSKESLWVEKYRPSTLEDCILPEDTKQVFRQYVDDGEVSNMLLTGSPGVGKTTAARALANDIGADVMFINGSDESGIDVLRNKIKSFASTVSLTGKKLKKIVIIDEADYLNPNSFQPALRAFMEEFSNTCRFILTCNYKNRIIAPLRESRLVNVDYTFRNEDKPQLMAEFMKRLTFILDSEQVEYDPRVLVELIKTHFPDYRKMINELQRYSKISGKIDEGILISFDKDDMNELMSLLKDKKFTDMRKWVGEHSDIIDSSFFSKVYSALYDYLQPASIPSAVVLLGQYQYWGAFVADQQLNVVACLTEIMGECMFK